MKRPACSRQGRRVEILHCFYTTGEDVYQMKEEIRKEIGAAQNRRQTGTAYESLAADYLSDRGMQILHRNYRSRHGEIDLIGMDGNYLVFVEVKYRASGKMGDPLAAVDARKQRRILDTARHYLYENHYRTDAPVRFDCVGITGKRIEWVKNAFRG